jgi:hypothetical protein
MYVQDLDGVTCNAVEDAVWIPAERKGANAFSFCGKHAHLLASDRSMQRPF